MAGERKTINFAADENGLYDFEVSRMASEIRNALVTTNGNTGPVNMTARQAATLLKCYLTFLEPRMRNDIPWRKNKRVAQHYYQGD